MTYQVLARKWRPRSFEELVGQQHITSALTHALTTQQLHHAYLFSGTRGVGKTTIARILAKCLNCEQGVSSTPCGSCAACVEIDKGRYPDLIEVDAASRTKVEDTRELLDNVVYAPSQGRYKIYLIDEVHMLSGHSFNALLKTLEEPPEHVIFIFATTDPEKMPATVISRCLQFQLRPIAQSLLEQHLTKILTEQGHAFDEQAIQLLAYAAFGSLRDALSLTEQAIGLGQGEVKRDAVEQMLGCQFSTQLPTLLQAITTAQTEQAFALIEDMAQAGIDFTSLLDAMLAAFHGWAVCLAVEGSEHAMTHFAGVTQEAIDLYKDQSQEQTQLYYQIALKGKQDLPLAPSLRLGFEMTVLRLMHFKPFEVSSQLSQPASQEAPTPKVASRAAPVKTSAVKQSAKPGSLSPRPQKTISSTKPQIQAQSQPRAQAQAQAKASDVPEWETIAQKLQLVGLAKVLVQNCVISQWELPKIKLTLDAKQAVCLNDDRKTKIEKALSTHLKQPIDLVIQSGDVGDDSPMQQTQIKQQAAQSKAEQLLQQDSNAQAIIQAFDGVVEKVSLNEDESRS